jgi:cyclopropane fatty-acyl-phospholipid synthase-like methyltransferase
MVVSDYRDVDPDQPYDKIVSVGMVEHVGRNKLDEYFQSTYQTLKPGGLFLNHAISTHRRRPLRSPPHPSRPLSIGLSTNATRSGSTHADHFHDSFFFKHLVN